MRTALLLSAALLAGSGCIHRPTSDAGIIVASLTAGPNNLDPRFGTDDSSQKIHALIFDNFMELDDHMRVVPKLAAALEHPDPLTYVATLRRGVRFHDGHELTAADVIFTFKSTMDPDFLSPRRGAYREVASIEARDPYTVVFRLNQPFESFPINMVMPIVPDGATRALQAHPMGTGPYRFVAYKVDDQIELSAFKDYFEGPPRNEGVILKIVPDEVMRGLELRKGTIDLVVNDVGPDIVFQLKDNPALRVVEGPGVDYQYVGINLRDPVLKDLRVRQALAYAINRHAIVDSLRRGLAVPAAGMLPPLSWAHAADMTPFEYDPGRARALLDEAGYPDPDGNGPLPRFSLTLKVTTTEFFRLQGAVIQSDLAAVGIDLDVRAYEFATLYADVLAGNFQLYTLQWTGGSVADPDILRRVFHSKQAPPAGFNRGHFSDPDIDALLERAAASTDAKERLDLFQEAQRRIAEQVPYISLWSKTNYVIAQRSLSGVRVGPLADFLFLKDIARARVETN